ncbi:outer membrane beta-barrel protein [Flavilitoribacter nigricans]|uniref:Opacity protein n=1 Tax=Flavilitoribacter nigricans (strain ATCC 23147 / DSM 23189 / NBRC 102662 / NCIMB 1420 / SS-2) TaxID=1122177 RepID=A0A2D0N8K4_FLAN2|nr:outer membrane beta-barrel protein [Flavilitoribacter nigricans]PHN04710.1 opacity protein [Flavilitoribacter nigricans DSM 23189 = NBRC 102662]
MKTSLAFLVAVMVFFGTSSLSGQNGFGVEFRPGANFATTELGDAELETGFGFEALAEYRFSRYLGVYGGWGWNKFSADQSFAGNKKDFEESGYLLGLQFSSTGNSNLGFYFRAGGVYNHIEVQSESGNNVADSKHGIGLRFEVGLDLHLGSEWYLRPGVKYQELSRDLTVETITTPVDLKYVSAGFGIAKRF